MRWIMAIKRVKFRWGYCSVIDVVVMASLKSADSCIFITVVYQAHQRFFLVDSGFMTQASKSDYNSLTHASSDANKAIKQ